MNRISKENYYLNIAQTVLERATCLRRVYGAIIVKNDEIISTGYNGSPRGRKNCVDMGFCTREAMQVPRCAGAATTSTATAVRLLDHEKLRATVCAPPTLRSATYAA